MLKNLKKQLESEKKDKNIFDIILYGSFVKGKEDARDIDIAVIFSEGSLRERLNKVQEIKSKLRKLHPEISFDIKQIILKDLFSTSFLARTGILMEGISVFHSKMMCETLGLVSYSLFLYDLKDLTHSQKVKFNYLLAGRGTKGIINDFGGERLVNGAIKIPLNKSTPFEEILKTNKINYKKKNILEEI